MHAVFAMLGRGDTNTNITVNSATTNVNGLDSLGQVQGDQLNVMGKGTIDV